MAGSCNIDGSVFADDESDTPQDPATNRRNRLLTQLFGFDLRSLALFRVCVAALILVDLLVRSRDLAAHYTDAGVLPAATVREMYKGILDLSLHYHLSGHTWMIVALFVVHGLCALALLLGWHTRLAVVLCWYFALSLHVRNGTILGGGDAMLRTLLIWGALLPLGARYSFDSALNTAPRRRTNGFLSVATVGVLVQFLVVYWMSVVAKSGPAWWDGRAVWYALNVDFIAKPPAVWLRQFTSVLPLLTHLTIWFEVFAPALLLVPFKVGPLRTLTVVMFMFFHACLGACLGLGIFAYVGVAMWTIFLPAWFWDKITARLNTPQRAGLRIYYDGDCGFCAKSARILRTFLLLSNTPLSPTQNDPSVYADMQRHNSWIVIDHSEKRHIKFDAFLLLCRYSPIAWPFAWLLRIPPIPTIGRIAYDFVATHRQDASAITGPFVPRPMRIEPGLFVQIVAGLFTLFVIVQNVSTIDSPWVARLRSRALAQITVRLQLDQRWYLFAPQPRAVDSWFVFDGLLADGSHVDPLRPEMAVTFDKPALVSATFPSMRWRCSLRSIAAPNSPRLVKLAEYLKREWDAKHPNAERLVALKIYMIAERTYDDHIGQPEPVQIFGGRFE